MSDMVDEDGNCLFNLQPCKHPNLDCDDCQSFLDYTGNQDAAKDANAEENRRLDGRY